jgi:hypothetical protein
VMRHCMWRVFGIPTPLSGALHTVASQHMTTLHNASGMHILCCEPAQVKYPLFATHFCATNHAPIFQIACALRVIGIGARSFCHTELRRSKQNNVRWIFASFHATIDAMSTPSQQTIHRVELRQR